jgi:hypothetical protein
MALLIVSCASESSVGSMVPIQPRNSPVLALWMVTKTPAGLSSMEAGASESFSRFPSNTYFSIVARAN